MQYKKCACCGKETLGEGSKFEYCPICGWQDDPVQNNDPYFWGGANLVTLNEARQVVAAGRDFRAYKKAAKEHIREQKKQAGQETEREPLTAAFI